MINILPFFKQSFILQLNAYILDLSAISLNILQWQIYNIFDLIK